MLPKPWGCSVHSQPCLVYASMSTFLYQPRGVIYPGSPLPRHRSLAAGRTEVVVCLFTSHDTGSVSQHLLGLLLYLRNLRVVDNVTV